MTKLILSMNLILLAVLCRRVFTEIPGDCSNEDMERGIAVETEENPAASIRKETEQTAGTFNQTDAAEAQEACISVLITAQDGSHCHKKLSLRGTGELVVESAAGRELIAYHTKLNLKEYFKKNQISYCFIRLWEDGQSQENPRELCPNIESQEKNCNRQSESNKEYQNTESWKKDCNGQSESNKEYQNIERQEKDCNGQSESNKEYQNTEVQGKDCQTANKETDETEEMLSENSGIQLLTLKKSGAYPVYPGILQIALAADGKGFYVVNRLSLEQYLPRVVASEMPERFGLEALKSQAVCARSYAAVKMTDEKTEQELFDRTGIFWNVMDTTADQVYNASPLNPLTIQACLETKGEILWDENGEKPVIPNYYSTSWGKAADQKVFEKGTLEAAAVLHSDISEKQKGANQAFVDTYQQNMNRNTEYQSPWFRWLGWIPLNRIFEKEVDAITVTKRGEGGYVSELLVEYRDGSKDKITGAGTVRQVLESGANIYYLLDGSRRQNMKLLPSPFFYLDDIVTEGKQQFAVIHGGGYGHGCGMSQYGAAELAKKGAGYREILSHYFRKWKLIVKNEK